MAELADRSPRTGAAPHADDRGIASLRASQQDGTRLRPQLLREHYRDLSGPWGFAHDDEDRGLREGWQDGRELGQTITVPFPPESPDSGIADTGFHPVIWYRRLLSAEDLDAAGFRTGRRLLLHFGAVDYRATVWLDGTLVGEHTGGHTPFAVDLTDAIGAGTDGIYTLVVRALDDPEALSQPRGKQDWQRDPHAIWYHRTSGIWQPVWLESVPDVYVTDLWWRSDETTGTASVQIRLNRAVPATLAVRIAHQGRELAQVSVKTAASCAVVHLPLAGQENGQGYEDLLWSPASPTLLDAWVRVEPEEGEHDAVASYLGLRCVGSGDGAFGLNHRPLVLRSVLSQGYWPSSHLAAPSADALRREAELIAELGFNAVRVHQKVEDPRFLFHADRLGLLVWGEMPAAYAFDERAIAATTEEWTAAVVRDRSHPSVVTWVPLNESWGVQHLAVRPEQRAFAESLYWLTKALDPDRLVISNDGWELTSSDLWTIHDYEADPQVLRRRYDGGDAALRALLGSIGPAGRALRLPGAADVGQPVMLTEFGGVKWAPGAADEDAWGYSEADGPEDFQRRLSAILGAVQAATWGRAAQPGGLAGWCWTQLTDTRQERNGLLTQDREPKLPMSVLRGLVQG